MRNMASVRSAGWRGLNHPAFRASATSCLSSRRRRRSTSASRAATRSHGSLFRRLASAGPTGQVMMRDGRGDDLCPAGGDPDIAKVEERAFQGHLPMVAVPDG